VYWEGLPLGVDITIFQVKLSQQPMQMAQQTILFSEPHER
jgi:hypothetical protein